MTTATKNFKVTSLITDIVLEVCWALPESLWPPALYRDGRHFRVWLLRGTTIVGIKRCCCSHLFICAGYVRFLLCSAGSSWRFRLVRRYCRFLQYSIVPLNSVRPFDKPCSNVGLGPGHVTKLKWLCPNKVTFREAGKVPCWPVVIFGLSLLALSQLLPFTFEV